MPSTPTTQAHLDTLQTQVEQDTNLTKAQRAQVQTHLYAIAVAIFGNAASPTLDGHAGQRTARQQPPNNRGDEREPAIRRLFFVFAPDVTIVRRISSRTQPRSRYTPIEARLL